MKNILIKFVYMGLAMFLCVACSAHKQQWQTETAETSEWRFPLNHLAWSAEVHSLDRMQLLALVNSVREKSFLPHTTEMVTHKSESLRILSEARWPPKYPQVVVWQLPSIKSHTTTSGATPEALESLLKRGLVFKRFGSESGFSSGEIKIYYWEASPAGIKLLLDILECEKENPELSRESAREIVRLKQYIEKRYARHSNVLTKK
jgi:hypothetical protein